MNKVGLLNYTEHVLDFQNHLLDKIFLHKKFLVSSPVITVAMTEIVGKK